MIKVSRFILSFSLILLLSIASSFYHTSVEAATRWIPIDTWQYAAKVAPPGLMQQVVQENVNPDWLGDPGKMQVIKPKVKGQKNDLYLINTRVQYECPLNGCSPLADPLCGSKGCAYLGYVRRGKSYTEVFNQYLRSTLPPDVTFLQVSNSLVLGLPCLGFTQLSEPTGGKLKIQKFCYDGNKYKFIASENYSTSN